MKKLVGLLLICVMLLGMSSVAFGLEDVLKVSKEIAINYTNGDLVKVKLVDSPKTKEVEISQEAMEYMAQNNKQLCINMDYVELTIDPKEVVNHSAWKAGLKKLEPLQLNLTVEVKDLANSVKYFSDGTYNGKGMYREPSSAFTLEINLLVGGKQDAVIKDLKGMKATTRYEWTSNWEVPTGGISANKLRLYFFNMDTEDNNINTVWQLVGGSVDTEKKRVTANIDKAGLYMLVASNSHTATNTPATNGSGQAVAFADIAGHWAKEDIEFLQSVGVIHDQSKNFAPKRNITRAEFATYLVNALSLTENTSLAGKFKDVAESKDYYKPVLTAAYHGVVSGTSANTFSPEASISRQEMATMFLRALNVANVSTGENTDTKLKKFTDAGKIASWAREGAMVAVNTGLIGGTTETTFAPNGTTTRGEAAAMLCRFYRYITK